MSQTTIHKLVIASAAVVGESIQEPKYSVDQLTPGLLNVEESFAIHCVATALSKSAGNPVAPNKAQYP